MVETFSQRIKDDIARFVAEPTREGLVALIRFFGGEFDQYELKEAWPPLPKIAKTTLAIANSGGGVIIFGIRDATLEPVGLTELASKQAVYETFRSFLPPPLLNEITLLDFDYSDAAYEPLKGKQIQVLAIPDIPEAIPFVCEEECHKDEEHVRRGAIYVRSGTNTREATYEQVQRILNRRLDTELPQSATRRVAQELGQLELLYSARGRAAAIDDSDPAGSHELHAYLNELIEQKQDLLEEALGLAPDAEEIATHPPRSGALDPSRPADHPPAS
jgi:predicted HTH transcriptional regulator